MARDQEKGRVRKTPSHLLARAREYQRLRRLTEEGRAKNRFFDRRIKWRMKITCLKHYGGDPPKCACCGETETGFLTLDHVNDDGQAHRRIDKAARANLIKWLFERGFPPEWEIRVMCFNCNMGRAINGGVCPHVTPMTLETFGRAKKTFAALPKKPTLFDEVS